MATVFGTAYEWGKTAHSYTNTDYAKQKSIEAMTGLVMLYALRKAVQGRVAESGGSMAVGAVLWMNHEAIIKQNLANTAVVFSTQVDSLSGQLDRVNEQIGQLEKLRVGGGELLGEQKRQLEQLRVEKDSLQEQVEGLKHLRDQIQEQVRRLEQTREQFDAHMAQTLAAFTQRVKDGSVEKRK